MKLRAKLILVLLPSIAVPLIALGWIAYAQQRQSVEEESFRQLDTYVDQIDRHVRARLEAARADVILFSNSQLLHDYLLVDDESQRFRLLQPALLKLFSSYQRANPEYYEIRVLLPDGYEDTRNTLEPIPNATEEEGDTEYFRSMREAEGDLLVQVAPELDRGEPALLLSQRIALVDPSDEPILAKPRLRGYLVVTMGLDFLDEQTRDAHLGHGGHIHVTNGEGRMLFSSDTSHAHDTLPSAFVQELRSSSGSASISRTEHEGETFLIRGSLPHENMLVYAALPETELLRSTRRLAGVTLALITGSIALTAALLYGVLRSLLLIPLARLGRATHEIGSGNLVTDLGIRRRDEIGELAASFEEMSSSLQQSHEQIAYLAYHDSLTGLPNRRMFAEELERSISTAKRDGRTLALLFVDVDDFKRVNDLVGHQAGDELLREIAERLTSVVRSYDTVARGSAVAPGNALARMGGDEFVVLLSHLGDPLQAGNVAQRILDALAPDVRVAGHVVHVNASIGITTYPQDGDAAEDLIRNADLAMYQAKERGKNGHRFYTPSLNTALADRMAMESDLRKAIEDDELTLYYQPQVDASTGEIVASEALIRWLSPARGLVMPGAFIPLAEETGLIVPIGEWVLREACRQNKAWQDAGMRPVPVAVNISNRQFAGKGLRDTVDRVLAETGLSPVYLDIELTETSIMEAPERVAETLAALKELGVQISMDDFGTGYSSLSALKRLPIDTLKIDQSFVRDLTTDCDDSVIVNTIIAMGKSLNLTVLAEGVEEADELTFLREHGCDRIQGYLISRPVPAQEMEGLFRSARPFLGLEEKPEPDA